MDLQGRKSKTLFKRAQELMPGGVNSPARAWRNLESDPIFIRRGQGAYLWDEDSRKYIDYVMSWGANILGHAHPDIIHTANQALENGLSFGAPTSSENDLANEIQIAFPSIESIRLVSSGTEACMSALRVARGFTKRKKILKFQGAYHGHSDLLLGQAGSGAVACPESHGVPPEIVQYTLNLPFNRLDLVKELFAEQGKEIAAIIVEPIIANSGMIRPQPDFLPGLREICDQYNSLLIFDEVITGYRVAYGGVQTITKVRPDLTTLGKIIGGGFPLAAYGGRREIMDQLAPIGEVYQAGTLAGHPIASKCAKKTLELLANSETYKQLQSKTQELCNGLRNIAKNHNVPIQTDNEGGLFGIFFSPEPVLEAEAVTPQIQQRYLKFFNEMFKGGVYLAPSAFESGFMSTAHSQTDIERTLQVADQAMATL